MMSSILFNNKLTQLVQYSMHLSPTSEVFIIQFCSKPIRELHTYIVNIISQSHSSIIVTNQTSKWTQPLKIKQTTYILQKWTLQKLLHQSPLSMYQLA